MKAISEDIIHFFQQQNFVIVSTIDQDGTPHSSCKGIVKIDQDGRVYLLDLYRQETYQNLKKNTKISITAVDEHAFVGYCLKGRAKIMRKDMLKPQLTAAWENRITSRITQRLIKNIRGERGHRRHPESFLPRPEYMIVIEVEKVVDLTPRHLK